MKYLLMGILSLYVFSAHAQTKKETEDWLIFYLNKFKLRGPNIVDGHDFLDSYSFMDKSLIQTRFFKEETKGVWKNIYIDLSKVIKIEDVTDTTYDSFLKRRPCLKICLYFKRGTSEIMPIQIKEDPILTNIYNFNYRDPFELDFVDLNILNNNIPQRLKKALEHLAALNGATIIKDVF